MTYLIVDHVYYLTCMTSFFRFRTGKIGFIGDIKQAFLQVEIAEKHRDFARFQSWIRLWILVDVN